MSERVVPAYRLTPNDMKRAASTLGCVLAVPHTGKGFRWQPRPDVILVTNNSTDAAWWQDLAEASSGLCLIRGRLQWVSTICGQTALYFGRQAPLFCAYFADFGVTFLTGATVTCRVCGRQFTPARSDARYHSNACRQKAYRQRGRR